MIRAVNVSLQCLTHQKQHEIDLLLEAYRAAIGSIMAKARATRPGHRLFIFTPPTNNEPV